MDKVQHLNQQAARAERLARAALDNLTVERLKQAAKEYLQQAEQLAAGR